MNASPQPRTLGIDPTLEERRALAETNWAHIVAASTSGEILPAVPTGTIAGGLAVVIGGHAGFLPASQVVAEPGTTLESLVKVRLPVKVIEVEAKRRRVVVSHRRAVEAMAAAKRTAFRASLAVGQIHEGTVRRVADFGAFVDVNGIEGLVPLSEFAFERIEHPSDVVRVGDTIAVAVLRVDDDRRRIAFSRKNALPDPWRDHPELLRVGASVSGTVHAKESGKEAGLLVEIAPGLIGRLGDGEVDPNDYEIGEAIDVIVRFVDRRTRRIRLGVAFELARATTAGAFASLGQELGQRNGRPPTSSP